MATKKKSQTAIGFKRVVKKGRHKKRYGPKQSRPKKYRGQGRA